QLRGLFPDGRSPYSALFEPLDHLRLLAGVGLFNNTLRIIAQYYNSNFSPAIMLNLGPFQFHAALNLSTSKVSGAWGLEITFRFRSPHDGFNKQTPYQTFARRANEKRKTVTEKEAVTEKDNTETKEVGPPES
ncbi:MAG: hypothetical protein AAF975_01935, partial [Spirochaetota bacterium]